MENETYRIKYDVGRFKPNELLAEDKGGCDAMVIASILREFPENPHGGSKSIALITVDGGNNGEDIPATELFQVFANIAEALIERQKELPEWQVELVFACQKYVREVMKEFRVENKGD